MNTSMHLPLQSSLRGTPSLSPRSVLVRCLLLTLVVSAAVSMTGCSFTVHEPRDVGMRRTTVGQELIDLKRAHESGVITEQEYEAKKTELLENRR